MKQIDFNKCLSTLKESGFITRVNDYAEIADALDTVAFELLQHCCGSENEYFERNKGIIEVVKDVRDVLKDCSGNVEEIGHKLTVACIDANDYGKAFDDAAFALILNRNEDAEVTTTTEEAVFTCKHLRDAFKAAAVEAQAEK